MCTTAYVPGVILLRVRRDGIPQLRYSTSPQLVIVPLPLRTGTAVHVLFCLVFFHRDVFIVLLPTAVACVVTTG